MAGQMRRKLKEMYNTLLDHFGPQHWWPGDGPLEMMAGAILTQNTNWSNVEKAIDNLKNRNLLSIETLNDLPEEKLARVIKPAGYFNVKAKRLKNLIRFLVDKYEGDLDKFIEEDIYQLREGLLSVKGVGPETADSIILYASKKPVFVIDAYTHRILSRHYMVEEQVNYDELQSLFMDNLPAEATLFNEFHALIVITGKEYCRRNPKCDICPLKDWE
ncbi:endonuclease III domain-containing protein [Thermodesulfobacteriota bacterium]